MPDQDWLWNQPKTWHDMNRALQDISVLLQYLGEMPEARLLSYFEDTQTRISDGVVKRTAPPCASYPDFLNRLFQIGSAFQTGHPDQLPAPERKSPDEPEPLSSIAFVYWSRDFLSAVAAPATADSIRLTRDFLTHRAWSMNPFGRWRRRTRTPTSPPVVPALPPDPDAPTRNRLASKLAGRVWRYEMLTMGAVAIAVLVSIYALSGRLILSNEQETREAWSKIDAQLEAQEDKVFKPATLPLLADGHAAFEVTSLCDLVQEVEAEPSRRQEAANGSIKTDASPAAPVKAEAHRMYAMAHQAHLCAERDKVLLNLFVTTLHLQSWSSAITQGMSDDWRIAGFRVSVPLGPLFGVVPATLSNFASEQNGDLCVGVTPVFKAGSGPRPCEKVLWDQINRSRNVAQSILGSITLYILPVLYGFLGAMAAAMRLLRRKVDASVVSYTDRARLQQGAILGLLCGGVLGLFAAYIGKADTAGGLGLSAIALLAGYNVDGVFRFLDELSDRIFRASPPPKAAS